MSEPIGERRQVFDDVVRIAELTVRSPEIRGYEFSNCRIIGPAIIIPIGKTQLLRCGWDGSDIDSIFWEIADDRQRVVGAVIVADCVFSSCSFSGVGIAGPRALRTALEKGFS